MRHLSHLVGGVVKRVYGSKLMGFTEMTVDVSFHGVRGSTPCSCPSVQRYGGNTSCVSIETANHDPIILDLGTGLRPWGTTNAPERRQTIHALLTHLHWDHIQGLPFFAPLLRENTTLNIYGCADNFESLAEAIDRFIAPPFFPIRTSDFAGQVNFIDVCDADFVVGLASVMAKPVRHVGATNGYRVNLGGVSVAYVPDHQQPVDQPRHVDDAVLELCAGVDLLIHDAQLWPDELRTKQRWGHSTPQYALEVAHQAGAKALALFHHDPNHDDRSLDEMVKRVSAQGRQIGVDTVFAAQEGTRLSFAADQRFVVGVSSGVSSGISSRDLRGVPVLN